MANSENLDLKRLDEPKSTTKFNHQIYYQNNFDKIDAAIGAPPSTLTTNAKTLVPAINELESDKVDKVTGKGLSTNDFDNTYKQKIDTDIPAQLKAVDDRVDLVEGDVTALENDKVDKVVGKQLSDENYTLTEKNKVANLPADTAAQLADIEQDKAEKTDIGLLSALLTTAKTSLVNAINELFSNKANKAQEAWITPTLLNGWEHFDSAHSVQYMKDQFGVVHVRGWAKHSVNTTNLPIFSFPVGYREGSIRAMTFVCPVLSNTLFTRISVAGNTGDVRHFGTATGYVDLSPIKIRVV